MVSNIQDRLVRWKQNLLDLTFRNPFLNFRHQNKSKSISVIAIINESPAVLFRILQMENASMGFLPWDREETASDLESEEYTDFDDADFDDDEPEKEQHDNLLQTTLKADRLPYVLEKMHKEALSWIDEKGVNALYLALGMLEYTDPQSADKTRVYKAPLLLLPVQLKKEGLKSGYTVSTTDDDPVLNPALVKKLELEFHISLPGLQEGEDDFSPEDFLNEIEQAIIEQPDWRITDECYLAFFSFQKFAMYRDMEENEMLYLEHPVVQSLCDPQKTSAPQFSQNFEAVELDTELPPENTYHIMDADSSQQLAILKVRTGNSIIIEGPPGTGKSQTITNLIADALAADKRILFVSEKKAALDVVFSRLRAKGLHDFCLELHGNKVSKRVILDELRRVLDKTLVNSPEDDSSLRRRLPILRQELSGYVQALHTPFGQLNKTPYRIIGDLQKIQNAQVVLLPFADVLKWTQEDLEGYNQLLAQHAVALKQVLPITEHPWKGCQLQYITSIEQELFKELLTSTHHHLTQLIESSQDFATQIGAVIPKTFGEVEVIGEVAAILSQSPHTSQEILNNPTWDAIPPEAAKLVKQGERYKCLFENAIQYYKESIFEEPVPEFSLLLERYKAKRLSPFWVSSFLFDKQFQEDRQKIAQWQRTGYKPKDLHTQFSELTEILEANRLRDGIHQSKEYGSQLFGEHWKGLDSDWQKLSVFSKWVVSVRGLVIQDCLNEKGLELAAKASLPHEKINTQIDHLRELSLKCHTQLEEIIQRGVFQIKVAEISSHPTTDLRTMRIKIEYLITHFNRLPAWVDYWHSLQKCLEKPQLAPYVQKYQDENYQPEYLSESFTALFYRQWLDAVIQEREALRQFRVHTHEEKRKEFQEADKAIIAFAQQRLLEHLHAQYRHKLNKEITGNKETKDELTLLQAQIRSIRGRKTLRQLLKGASNCILTIKPCFMMSPLSVAELIEPSKMKFDLVIFDEASQVTPEEALGAIVRAQQVVVVGDPKQLPPTNFFGKKMSLDESFTQPSAEEDEWLPDDEESILDQFGAAGFHSHGLKWHYRSRHEDLIAYSNAKFYKNLYTFPSADSQHPVKGLQFERIEGTYEGQGKNQREARHVVEAICHHIRHYPNRSLGVGTFGAAQKDLIDDLLAERRRHDSSLEFFFKEHPNEPFFVKNLENIQGDERDVIFLSVTYGPDASGRIKNQFGPLLGENGWRRLNVIVTRAKHCLKVFSSMRGDEIDLSKTNSHGARLLRDYLIFAEKKQLDLPEYDGDALTESPFEDKVYEALTSRGFHLVKQVGQSGYRIDFGVLDPEIPGLFIAGIECDGFTYHRSRTARDRDRLRQEVLEGLGWKIYRVWSTDWFRNSEAQADRLAKLIDEGRQAVLENRNRGEETQNQQIQSNQIPETPQIEFEGLSSEIETREIEDMDNPAEEEALSAKLSAEIPEIKPYQITPITVKGTSETFSLSPNIVEEVILRVLEIEAPIHMDELARRVSAHWGISRTTARISNQIATNLQQLQPRHSLVIKDNFVYQSKLSISFVEARDRVVAGITPKAELIPIEEYQASVKQVLMSRGAILIDDLQKEVARFMGFARCGPKVQQAIDNALTPLFENGRLSNVASGVQWNNVDLFELITPLS